MGGLEVQLETPSCFSQRFSANSEMDDRFESVSLAMAGFFSIEPDYEEDGPFGFPIHLQAGASKMWDFLATTMQVGIPHQ